MATCRCKAALQCNTTSRHNPPPKKQLQLLQRSKRCGQKVRQLQQLFRRTRHGDLVAAGGMNLPSLDAHDLAFSF